MCVSFSFCCFDSPPFYFFIVDAEAVCFLQGVIPYLVQPHAVVVRCSLHIGSREALFLQCFDCTFAFVLCHLLKLNAVLRTASTFFKVHPGGVIIRAWMSADVLSLDANSRSRQSSRSLPK